MDGPVSASLGKHLSEYRAFVSKTRHLLDPYFLLEVVSSTWDLGEFGTV
jgi:hypothetical protein